MKPVGLPCGDLDKLEMRVLEHVSSEAPLVSLFFLSPPFLTAVRVLLLFSAFYPSCVQASLLFGGRVQTKRIVKTVSVFAWRKKSSEKASHREKLARVQRGRPVAVTIHVGAPVVTRECNSPVSVNISIFSDF